MSSRPDPASLASEYLSVAEEASLEVLNCIHPTVDSEEERSDVIDHLRRLIKAHVNCDVFPNGSVPLKTYLPDGDIDLTVLRDPSAGESLADDVLAILREEEQKGNSEYQINDTQFIGAEVKLVKCIAGNIMVDISFNQLSGLSTLCFLEQAVTTTPGKIVRAAFAIYVTEYCWSMCSIGRSPSWEKSSF